MKPSEPCEHLTNDYRQPEKAGNRNRLRIEYFEPMLRCKLKPPEHWGPKAPSAARWLLSGGDPMVFGFCNADCPKKKLRQE